MSRPSRRGVLRGIATLSVAGALPVAAETPDAGLIQTCNRYLEIEQNLADPMRPDAHLDCDQAPEWPEFLALEAAVRAAEPQTKEGEAALARVALLCSMGDHLREWDDNDAQRLAYKLLLRLAGPGIGDDIASLQEVRARNGAIIRARYAGKAVAS